MKRSIVITLLSVFTYLVAPNVFAINIEKVAKNNHSNIKKIKKTNRELLGHIEQLQESQKLANQKIAQLFQLMEYKKSANVVKETMMRVREENKKAKKLYTNARSLLVTDQYNQSIDLFLNYLATYPDNNYVPDASYWLAKAYAAKGDRHNAEKVFHEFQQNHPSHHKYANSLYELATIYHESKDYDKALMQLTSMIKKFPNHNSIFQAQALLQDIEAVVANKKDLEAKESVKSKQ